MTTENEINKRIIKALAKAPAAAIRELLEQTSNREERERIKLIAAALGIKIGENEK